MSRKLSLMNSGQRVVLFLVYKCECTCTGTASLKNCTKHHHSFSLNIIYVYVDNCVMFLAMSCCIHYR